MPSKLLHPPRAAALTGGARALLALPIAALALAGVTACMTPVVPVSALPPTPSSSPPPSGTAAPAAAPASSTTPQAGSPAGPGTGPDAPRLAAPLIDTPFEARRVALEAGAMGTKVTIAAFTTRTMGEETLRPAIARALDEIRRLEAVMTTWREDSEVSRVNAAAGRSAVNVGPDTLAVIQKSLWIAERSEGTFDITFDAMRGIWKFDEGAEDRVPSRATIEAARRLIDWKQVIVDPAASTVKLGKPNMRISLGGIAKGYAVDAAAKILDAAGVPSFFVQAGGDLFVRGTKPDGSRFKVGVRDPRGAHENDFFASLEVVNHSFSTAGDYERSFVKDGRRYHHIIDPRTGYPADACRSVTIWAADAFTADAVDDAVFLLGPEKGLALVESIDGVGAVIVDKSNRVWVSRRLAGLVRQFRAPTDGI